MSITRLHLRIGVRERHHDVKPRMFRDFLVGVDLQRFEGRTKWGIDLLFRARGFGKSQ